MIIKYLPKRLCINQYGFFSQLKDRYKCEKDFHLLNEAGQAIKDNEKKLEFMKQLIIMRSEIDGDDKVGIQTIKSYLDYLSFYDLYLHKYKKIEKADQVFYKIIEKQCYDVNLIQQATLSSRFFYYLNGGDNKLLCLELQCKILVRKLNSQNKNEEASNLDLLKDAVDEYVEYAKKHYSNSEQILFKAMLAKEEYHLIKAQIHCDNDNYQATIDDIVNAQTQMKEFWQNSSQKEGMRILYQAKIIKKLIALGRVRCKMNQPEGLQIIVNALKMYEDNIGIDDTYQEHFTQIVQFLIGYDENMCLLLLEGISQHPYNKQRLELEQIRIALLFTKQQLKESDVDQMIETYKLIQADDEDPNYEVSHFQAQILIFVCQYKNFFNNKGAAFKLLEEAIRKLSLLSPTEQSTGIIKIINQMMLNCLQQDVQAQLTIELSIQILNKSNLRLKDNFSQLQYDDQIKTINTERGLLFFQFYLDKHKIANNQCEQFGYKETFNRLDFLVKNQITQNQESLFQSNRRLKLPILEILNNVQVEDKDVVEKIMDVRQKILDTEII